MGASSSWITGWCLKENHNNENFLNYLGHLKNEIQSIGGIISELMGAFLAYYIPENSYKYVFFITFILMILVFFLVLFIPNIVQNKPIKHNVFFQTKKIFKLSILSKKTFLFFLSTSLITALYQPLFHFWQPFFKDLNVQIFGDENIIFGICFAAFNISAYLVNRNIKLKALKNNDLNFSSISIFYTFIVFFAFLILSLHLNHLLLAILLFCILHGSLSLISVIINDQYIKKDGKEHVASIISLGEVFGRLSSLCVLWFIYICINTMSISAIFLISSFIVMLLIVTLQRLNKILTSKKENL
jgi:hypothetical protein